MDNAGRILKAALLGALLSLAGCGDNECAPVADGFYRGSNGSTYTIQNGLPLGFQGWNCQPTGACGAYSCTEGNETVAVVLDGGELTIDGQAIALTAAP